MSPSDIALVQESWKKVVPIQDQAAALFYGKLFELDASLRPLFKGDLEEQGRKLMLMLNTVVSNLARLETVLPVAQSLARRHVAYGVQPAHYATVGAALIWTLEAGLGTDFTAPTRGAWLLAYTTLSGAMIDASQAA